VGTFGVGDQISDMALGLFGDTRRRYPNEPVFELTITVGHSITD
jgi:hypothetical protein